MHNALMRAAPGADAAIGGHVSDDVWVDALGSVGSDGGTTNSKLRDSGGYGKSASPIPEASSRFLIRRSTAAIVFGSLSNAPCASARVRGFSDSPFGYESCKSAAPPAVSDPSGATP